MAKVKGVLSSVIVLATFSADFKDKESGKTIEYHQLHGYQTEAREFLKVKLSKDHLATIQPYVGQICDIEVETDTTSKGNPLLCRIQPTKVQKVA